MNKSDTKMISIGQIYFVLLTLASQFKVNGTCDTANMHNHYL